MIERVPEIERPPVVAVLSGAGADPAIWAYAAAISRGVYGESSVLRRRETPGPAAQEKWIRSIAEMDALAVVVPYARRSSEPIFFNRDSAVDLLAAAPVPVVLVPPAVRLRHGSIRGVVVALDGSAQAERGLDPAASLCRDGQAQLLLLRVLEPAVGAARYSFGYGVQLSGVAAEALDRIAQRLRRQAIDVQFEVTSGFTAPRIASVAREVSADLIVMTTRAPRGFRRTLGGSRLLETLDQSTVPIMALGPSADWRSEPQNRMTFRQRHGG
jgi:nucleotide-binding universal stress UspA family protein